VTRGYPSLVLALLAACGGRSSGGATDEAGAASALDESGNDSAAEAASDGSEGDTTSTGLGCQPGTIPCGRVCCVGCCGGQCVDTSNDPHNCGGCGIMCTGDTPFCDGTCKPVPCSAEAGTCAAGTTCCGGECCNSDQLCCASRTFGGPPPVYCQVGGNTCAPACLYAGGEPCTCAAPDTAIATPDGERPIAEIRIGDLVYSVDHDAIRAVPVLRVSRQPARNHHALHVVTSDGRTLEISAGHPTADGRSFGDLQRGGSLDGHTIESIELVPYEHEATYDILPASDTGTYFAAGMQIGSTLQRSGAR
jgi:hypothetical protein